MSDGNDYTGFKDEPSDDVVGQIAAMVGEWQDYTRQRNIAESHVRRYAAQIEDIERRRIPELMDKQQVSELTTDDGLKVSVKETIKASISAERREDAFRWLQDSGNGDIIKTQVLAAFARGKMDDARHALALLGHASEVWDLLDNAKHETDDPSLFMDKALSLRGILDSAGGDTSLKEKVEPQTLSKLVREMLAAGEEVPQETLGVVRLRSAKIVVPKPN